MRPASEPATLVRMTSRPATARRLAVVLAAALIPVAAPSALVSPADASAQARSWTGNLVRNGSAEKTSAAPTDYYPPVTVKGWKATDSFTAAKYVAAVDDPYAYGNLLAKNSPGPGARGNKYFVGAYKTSSATKGRATQVVGLAKQRSRIKRGAQAKLVAWLGGYASNEDRMKVTLVWLTKGGKKIKGGTIRLSPVTRLDRDPTPPEVGEEYTELQKRSGTAKVPGRAWKAKVQVIAVRGSSGVSGAYADKISLKLR